jgi:non-specific protein-tyrosine kinase
MIRTMSANATTRTGSPREQTPGAVTVLWKRRWTIVVVTLLVVAVAIALSVRVTPICASKASVLVESAPNQTTTTEPNMATEKQVATSTSVARIVMQKLHLTVSAQTVLNHLSVSVPVDTQILDISYSDPQPRIAQQRAQAFAEAYVSYRQQGLLAQLADSQRTLQTQTAALTTQLGDLQSQIDRETNANKRALEQAQASSLIAQISILQQKLAALDPTQSAPPGRLLEPAPLPLRPVSPNYPVNIALSVFAGLALGAFAALLREYADDRIRGREDLEARLGTPVLAAIQTTKGKKDWSASQLVTSVDPRSVVSESFAQLRANLAFAAHECGAQAILVTSCREQEGKTFTSANVAVALARSGKRVIAVSGDVRRPRLEQMFGLSPSVGLIDALVDDVDVSSLLTDVGIDHLALLPAGLTPGNPNEFLASDRMAMLLADLRGLSDFVIIDAPPLLAVADAAILAASCDGVLFVCDERSVTRKDIARAREQLERTRTIVLGAVLNNAHADGPRGYYAYA